MEAIAECLLLVYWFHGDFGLMLSGIMILVGLHLKVKFSTENKKHCPIKVEIKNPFKLDPAFRYFWWKTVLERYEMKITSTVKKVLAGKE